MRAGHLETFGYTFTRRVSCGLGRSVRVGLDLALSPLPCGYSYGPFRYPNGVSAISSVPEPMAVRAVLILGHNSQREHRVRREVKRIRTTGGEPCHSRTYGWTRLPNTTSSRYPFQSPTGVLLGLPQYLEQHNQFFTQDQNTNKQNKSCLANRTMQQKRARKTACTKPNRATFERSQRQIN